jgi:tetratricopeptide (TPR) repeat protein
VTTSQTSAQSTYDVLYRQGRERRQAGDPAAAIELLAQAVALCPDNLDYTMELAQAYAVRENWAAVERLLSPLQDKLAPDGLGLLASAHTRTRHPRQAAEVLERGLRRFPESEKLWLALIDHTLGLRQCELALRRISQAERHLGPTAALQFRAAQAYHRLGQGLGRARVLSVPGGHVGQFVNDWLLVERRDEADRFLCCPPTSALYALRRALDAGLDEPAAHLLHARIWQQAGRPEIGLAILQAREALWLENPSPETLRTLAELALAANALDDFLRYARLQAAREPHRRTEILFEAFRSAAERYNQRGDAAMTRELLWRALALRPEDTAVMLQLADATWDAVGQDEAVTWYRRVLEREPTHPERRRILQRLDD